MNIDAKQTIVSILNFRGDYYDFANEPETILKAFKDYDDGAELADVQDLNIVYDMKIILDDVGIYQDADLEKFKNVNVNILKSKINAEQIHRKLYSATQKPTDVFNSKLQELTKSIKQWEAKYNIAYKANDETAMKANEAKRSEATKQREELMRFKANLLRFVKVYSYIAQLIELNAPELENFANFAKLLSKRLNGVSQDQVDLSGLVLKGYKISKIDQPDDIEGGSLTGIKANEHDATYREKEFLASIISRLNILFGDTSDEEGQRHFVNQIINAVINNKEVTEQINKNTKEQALSGDLPDEVKKIIVKAMKSHMDLAKISLAEQQNIEDIAGIAYDVIKSQKGEKKDTIL